MTQAIKLSFTIPVSIYLANKNTQITAISQKHTTAICKYIKYNSILNSQYNIISRNHGIITLIETNISCSNNILTFNISLNTEHNCDLSIDSAEDIISSILPGAYSNDDSYIFKFNIDSLFIIEKYYLIILEIPSNITIHNT